MACILGKPLAQPPGTVFKYTDASVHLAGAMVQRAVGRALDDYAPEHLFGPIGINGFHWLHHRDGLAYGAYGLFLTPRDFLRFGQAALRAKRHEASAVVSPAWIDNAIPFQVKPNFDASFDFGLLWWLTPDGSAFTASGHGGQFADSIPALDLEVVVTADLNSKEDSVSVNVTDAKALADTRDRCALMAVVRVKGKVRFGAPPVSAGRVLSLQDSSPKLGFGRLDSQGSEKEASGS